MSVGNNIIDASRDLIISVGHNITYHSMKYYPDISFDNPNNPVVILRSRWSLVPLEGAELFELLI
jgi:hypothetical protein